MHSCTWRVWRMTRPTPTLRFFLFRLLIGGQQLVDARHVDAQRLLHEDVLAAIDGVGEVGGPKMLIRRQQHQITPLSMAFW